MSSKDFAKISKVKENEKASSEPRMGGGQYKGNGRQFSTARGPTSSAFVDENAALSSIGFLWYCAMSEGNVLVYVICGCIYHEGH